MFTDKEIATIIINDILDEVDRAEKKHPNWPDNPYKGMAIIGEELGEANQALLQSDDEGGTVDDVRKELIETAATCIRMIKNL